MGKYITKFETQTLFDEAKDNLDKPHVSLIEENMGVYYDPYVPETRVIAKYNVTDTSKPTALRTNYEQNIFKSMEIDGMMLDELVTEYTFDTTGVHTVKYELYDETKLGNNAPVFFNNNLVECIMPSSVTSVGSNAFAGCISLTSMVIPDNITSIGSMAFGGCSGLISITIPDNITSIGSMAFGGCSGLISITIPDSVTNIGSAILSGTEALKVLNYNAKCDLSNDIRNNASWLNLETVIIGDSTPSISNGAFAYCSGLTSVTIGSGITSIGYGVFTNCSGLTSIISNATTAPTIQSTTFNGIKTDGTLTVPAGSTGYDVWMSTGDYYLGKYNWTKVEQ